MSKQLRSVAPFVANADPGSGHIATYVGWQISGLFFAVSVIASVAFAAVQLLTYRDVKTARKLLALTLTLFVQLLYYWIFSKHSGISIQTAQLLYLERTEGIHPQDLVGLINVILIVTQLLTMVSFASLALAAFTIVDSLVHIDTSFFAEEAEARQLERNTERLRILVFIGSALLFSGLIGVYASIAWRASLVDQASATHITNLGKVIVLVWVSIWTICLLLTYALSALCLHDRVYNLADRFGDREKLFKQYGLQLSFGDLLVKAFAILGPIITTVLPLKELIKISD